MVTHDLIVLGAGGAGMMCAALAGQRGLRVLLLDHGDAPGRKILISGGGRCNFTNLYTAPERFLSSNPHFARSALQRYRPADFIALVERHGIAWHEKTLGQLFCDGSARAIVNMLADECRAGGVQMRLGVSLTTIDHADGIFRVADALAHDEGPQAKERPREASAPELVIATGGPSIPKIGATDFAYGLARRFGLKVIEPRPALVPLTLGEDCADFRALAGVSCDVVARAGKAAFREACLFTHRGLSGPAILQASSYWHHRTPVTIDFTPGLAPDWLPQIKRARPRVTLAGALAEVLPSRLAQVFAQRLSAGLPLAGQLSQLGDRALEQAMRALASWSFLPNGTEGFKKAEVTLGGVDTRGLSSQTMAARHLPGLYVIGEAVDVTGWLGGYNFQWAWASAHAAAQAVGRSGRGHC